MIPKHALLQRHLKVSGNLTTFCTEIDSERGKSEGVRNSESCALTTEGINDTLAFGFVAQELASNATSFDAHRSTKRHKTRIREHIRSGTNR
jgi:hypothetical protein